MGSNCFSRGQTAFPYGAFDRYGRPGPASIGITLSGVVMSVLMCSDEHEHDDREPRGPAKWASLLDVRCVSSVSESWLDTCVYPVYLTVTRLLAMVCVSSVSEMRPETQCTWCIRRPPFVYLTSRVRSSCVRPLLPRPSPFSPHTPYPPLSLVPAAPSLFPFLPPHTLLVRLSFPYLHAPPFYASCVRPPARVA